VSALISLFICKTNIVTLDGQTGKNSWSKGRNGANPTIHVGQVLENLIGTPLLHSLIGIVLSHR
jgi:hypothetical protein